MTRARVDHYFGAVDASTATVDALTTHHVFRGIEQRVKWGAQASGLQVIVGVKGSGKTDLRRYLEAQDDSYVLHLDADHAYLSLDAARIREPSGRTKNAVAAILLREFAGRAGESHRSSRTGKALRRAFAASTSTLARLPDAVDLSVPGATVRLGDLLKRDAAAVLQVTLDDLVGNVVNALRDRRGAIMIDDVDDVFAGVIENPLFLEGVARAVHDINLRGQNSIHVLLFVKHGLWRAWFENQREYDRVKGVIGFLSWDHKALIEARSVYRRSCSPGWQPVT